MAKKAKKKARGRGPVSGGKKLPTYTMGRDDREKSAVHKFLDRPDVRISMGVFVHHENWEWHGHASSVTDAARAAMAAERKWLLGKKSG
jgi:hypothetical protein